jgi:hypothetical protein
MDRALDSILRFDILAEHGIIVCETAAERELPPLPAIGGYGGPATSPISRTDCRRC